MTYNFVLVQNLLRTLNDNNKKYFLTQIFPNGEVLKNAISNEISDAIYIKNGLRRLKVPIKNVGYSYGEGVVDYTIAILEFDKAFVNREFDSYMVAIAVSDKGEIRVFSLKMCTDTNNIRHAGVFEQKMDGKVKMHGSTQNPSMGSFLTRIFDIILGKA